MGNDLSGSDDISQAHLCAGCRTWVPDGANFCGRCGRPQRPLPVPSAAALQEIERRYRRRRRRAIAWGLGPLALLILGVQERDETERLRHD